MEIDLKAFLSVLSAKTDVHSSLKINYEKFRNYIRNRITKEYNLSLLYFDFVYKSQRRCFHRALLPFFALTDKSKYNFVLPLIKNFKKSSVPAPMYLVGYSRNYNGSYCEVISDTPVLIKNRERVPKPTHDDTFDNHNFEFDSNPYRTPFPILHSPREFVPDVPAVHIPITRSATYLALLTEADFKFEYNLYQTKAQNDENRKRFYENLLCDNSLGPHYKPFQLWLKQQLLGNYSQPNYDFVALINRERKFPSLAKQSLPSVPPRRGKLKK